MESEQMSHFSTRLIHLQLRNMYILSYSNCPLKKRPLKWLQEEATPLDLRTAKVPLTPVQSNFQSRPNCPTCGKIYSTHSGLNKHLQGNCGEKKHFACQFCAKSYLSLGALKMHIRTHTLPCKCEICGKAFSRPWLLQGHIRTHTGEKPFTCSFAHCPRSFADRSNLRAHLTTHSQNKKYGCPCGKTFSRNSLLVKHKEQCF